MTGRAARVKSLARPGSNVTGFANITHDLGPKRLELLLTLMPRLARVAVLTAGGNPGEAATADALQALAHRRHVTMVQLAASDPKEIEAAFAAMARDKVGALIAPLTPLFSHQKAQIAHLAAQLRLPVQQPTVFELVINAGVARSMGLVIPSELRLRADTVIE